MTPETLMCSSCSETMAATLWNNGQCNETKTWSVNQGLFDPPVTDVWFFGAAVNGNAPNTCSKLGKSLKDSYGMLKDFWQNALPSNSIWDWSYLIIRCCNGWQRPGMRINEVLNTCDKEMRVCLLQGHASKMLVTQTRWPISVGLSGIGFAVDGNAPLARNTVRRSALLRWWQPDWTEAAVTLFAYLKKEPCKSIWVRSLRFTSSGGGVTR